MHDLRPTTAFCYESTGEAVATIALERTAVIHSIQLVFAPRLETERGEPKNADPDRPASSSGKEGPGVLSFLVARMIPHVHRLSADRTYAESPPLLLSCFPFPGIENGSGEMVMPLHLPQRWRIEGGTTVLLTVATKDTLAQARQCLEAASRRASSSSGTSPITASAFPPTSASGAAAEQSHAGAPKPSVAPSSPLLAPAAFPPPFPAAAVRVRLHGKSIGFPFSSGLPLMRPLMCHRWYELRPSVGRGTITGPGRHPQPAKSSKRRERRRQHSALAAWQREETDDVGGAVSVSTSPLSPGQVREAVAVSVNGRFILWNDGSTGLMSEVRPYCRYFLATAGPSAGVAVLERPRGNARIVGRLPAGVVVEALGAAQSEDATYAYVFHVCCPGTSTGRGREEQIPPLLTVNGGRRLWGWVKVSQGCCSPRAALEPSDASVPPATRSRVITTFLKDVSSFDVSHGTRVEEVRLRSPNGSEPHLYGVRCGDRGVRIRSAPSLRSSSTIVSVMEPNEVKEAAELLRFTGPADQPGVKEFVRWSDGHYSLARHNDQIFLEELRRVVLRPQSDAASQLKDRKRFRNPLEEGEDEEDQREWTDAPDGSGRGAAAGHPTARRALEEPHTPVRR